MSENTPKKTRVSRKELRDFLYVELTKPKVLRMSHLDIAEKFGIDVRVVTNTLTHCRPEQSVPNPATEEFRKQNRDRVDTLMTDLTSGKVPDRTGRRQVLASIISFGRDTDRAAAVARLNAMDAEDAATILPEIPTTREDVIKILGRIISAVPPDILEEVLATHHASLIAASQPSLAEAASSDLQENTIIPSSGDNLA